MPTRRLPCRGRNRFISKPTGWSSTRIRGMLQPRGKWSSKRPGNRFCDGHSVCGEDGHDEIAVGSCHDSQSAATGPFGRRSRCNHEAAPASRARCGAYDAGGRAPSLIRRPSSCGKTTRWPPCRRQRADGVSWTGIVGIESSPSSVPVPTSVTDARSDRAELFLTGHGIC